MYIQITQNTCILRDDTREYKDTADNLVTHSGGLFQKLPDNIRNYLKRTYQRGEIVHTQEMWVDYSSGEAIQTNPDPTYSQMVNVVWDALDTIISNKNTLTQDVWQIIGLPDEPGQFETVNYGDSLSFQIEYSDTIDGSTEVQILISFFGVTRLVNIPIEETPQQVELLLQDRGQWLLIPQNTTQPTYDIRVV